VIVSICGLGSQNLCRSLSTKGRHDDPEEKARDAMREKLLETHRFRSFAHERDGNIVKWYFPPLFFPSYLL